MHEGMDVVNPIRYGIQVHCLGWAGLNKSKRFADADVRHACPLRARERERGAPFVCLSSRRPRSGGGDDCDSVVRAYLKGKRDLGEAG